MSQISLWIDHYDDIFSDFDPRPYSQRALSDDFIQESTKVAKGKSSDKLELNFLISADQRSIIKENTIKKRLRDYFNKSLVRIREEHKGIIRQGSYFLIIGSILMFTASYLLFTHSEKSIITSFLITLLEPASWFLFWEGLNLILFKSKHKKPELEFYGKMSKSEINFLSYSPA